MKLNIPKNMSGVERTVRIAAALVILVLYGMNQISGTVAAILLSIALMFVLTSAVSFCPAYRILGIDRWVKK